MKNKKTIQNFIKKRPYLVWYVKSLKNLSEDSILESVLNYGNFEDFLELERVMGKKKTKKIFKKRATINRTNFRPEIKNYFTLYFNKYA